MGRPTRSEGWAVYEPDDGYRHIVPLNDRRRHIISMGCWCLPAMDDEDRDIIVHRAEDSRE
jgi:hypothetical protein